MNVIGSVSCAKHQGQPIRIKWLKGMLNESMGQYLKGRMYQWMKTLLSSGDKKAVTTAVENEKISMLGEKYYDFRTFEWMHNRFDPKWRVVPSSIYRLVAPPSSISRLVAPTSSTEVRSPKAAQKVRSPTSSTDLFTTGPIPHIHHISPFPRK